MPESPSPRGFTFASSHPFHPPTQPSSSSPPVDTMTPATSSQQPEIPFTNLPPPPTYAGHTSHRSNTDLEAAFPSSGPTLNRYSSESPPNYKEQDMPEPLPPYMTRVRGVIRGQQPMAAAMPVVERRTAWYVVAFFALAVLIVVGVGIGVRIALDDSHDAPPP